MPGLAGYWPSRSVTFIDNHDTGKHYFTFTGCIAMGCCTSARAYRLQGLAYHAQLYCTVHTVTACCDDCPCNCRQDWPCLCFCPCPCMFRAFILDGHRLDRSSSHASKGKHGHGSVQSPFSGSLMLWPGISSRDWVSQMISHVQVARSSIGLSQATKLRRRGTHTS